MNINFTSNNNEKCNEEFAIINKDLCEKIATTYWIIVILIASLVISFITLFPVFIMRKKNDKHFSPGWTQRPEISVFCYFGPGF